VTDIQRRRHTEEGEESPHPDWFIESLARKNRRLVGKGTFFNIDSPPLRKINFPSTPPPTP